MKIEIWFLASVTAVLSVKTERLISNMAHKREVSSDCLTPGGVPFMVPLLHTIAKRYFKLHTTIFLYDDYFYYHTRLKNVLELFIGRYGYPLRHGRMDTTMAKPKVPPGLLEARENELMAFIVFAKEPEIGAEVIRDYTGEHTYAVIMAQTSSYLVKSFLQTKLAADITNLLVLVDPIIKDDLFAQKAAKPLKECDILILSHEIATSSLGGSHAVIKTAWRRDHFTRQVPLYTSKFESGLGGLHLVVSAAEIPPFVFRKQGQDSGGGYTTTAWEGIEVRLMRVLGNMLNFSVEFKEPALNATEDASQLVVAEVKGYRANMAVGGVYLTPERAGGLSFSMPHTQDCASFISLASTALPKYRAIMGPFLWDTWLALTAVYVFAMFPIAFSVWHSIKPLLNDFWEVENMFWYVFGTFTNCFTFTGKNSWSQSDKSATKIFIGTYWIFTIIITACYTGSIVAFITLPVFPETIDSSEELLEENYKVSILGTGGWERLFMESDDKVTQKLYKSVDLVPDLYSGLKNVTKNVHEWRRSAFLGSRRLLEYTVRANFTPEEESMRLLFHLSEECFVPLLVSFILPRRTPFLEKFNNALERALQAGFMEKVTRDMEWDVYRSASGKLLKPHKGFKGAPEDRELNLDDTQGIFLLLGAGFSIAIFILTLELIYWAKGEVKNRQFGELTLRQRAINKLKEHWDTIYSCLLAPSTAGTLYLQQRRVSSAFGEYVTRPYSPLPVAVIPSPTVQSSSPVPPDKKSPSPPPNGAVCPRSPGAGESLSVEQLPSPHDKPVRLMSF